MKCISCNQKGFIEIPYTKIWFCKNCFLRLMHRRISKVVKTHKMIGKNEKVAISFCGNANSIVLYDFFKGFEGKKIKKLYPVFIDFGFEKSSKIKNLCKNLTVIKSRKPKNCDECRKKRKKEIIKFMRKNKIKKLVSLRNLDSEVILFVSSFMKKDFNINDFGHVVRNKIITVKPLIEIPTDELVPYANLKGLKYYNLKCPLKDKHYNETKDFLENLKKSRKMIYFCILKSIKNIKEAI